MKHPVVLLFYQELDFDINQKLLDLDFSPGVESSEVKLFQQDEIPWDELAFTAIRETLKFYLDDKKTGKFQLHTGDIIKNENCYDFIET